jgi:HK97 family phage prohead protease
MKEIRTLKNAELRTDGGSQISGYGVVFNSTSHDLGGFTERISPGAFSASLKDGDIRLLWNHDTSSILGRSRSGTLTLAEDAAGVKFACDLPNTELGRQVHETVRRGDVSSAASGSFAGAIDGMAGCVQWLKAISSSFRHACSRPMALRAFQHERCGRMASR